MIKMTKAKALAIQAKQIEWYCKSRPDLAKIIAEATTANQLKDDIEYDVVIINKHIPRGTAIEWLLGHKQGNLD